MKYCIKCRKQHGTVHDYCPNCGDKLSLQWKSKCPQCGHCSDFSDKFCVSCGSPLFAATGERNYVAIPDDK